MNTTPSKNLKRVAPNTRIDKIVKGDTVIKRQDTRIKKRQYPNYAENINSHVTVPNNSDKQLGIIVKACQKSPPDAVKIKRVAILFFGSHYDEKWKSSNTDYSYVLDFRQYMTNIKKKLFGFFEECAVDVFISSSESKMSGEFVEAYNAKSYNFTSNHRYRRNWKIRNVLELLISHISKTKTHYDLIVITRPDIYFVGDFKAITIDYDKLNILSMLEDERLIDDNLYMFPQKYLKVFYDISVIRAFSSGQGHTLLKSFKKFCDINFMQNEKTWIHNLSFYKLRHFINHPFIINKLDYTSNVTYEKIGASIFLSDNKILFRKTINERTGDATIGFVVKNIGTHQVSAEITSDIDINENFTLHSENETHNINLTQGQKLNINVSITTNKENEVIYFDCVGLPTVASITYENVKIT
jgi:hypothetical protein